MDFKTDTLILLLTVAFLFVQASQAQDGKYKDRSNSQYGKQSIRTARKLNLLRRVWTKTRISPLYLVNGTVCRFVNLQPVCTTLSTTGVVSQGGSTSGAASGGNRGTSTGAGGGVPQASGGSSSRGGGGSSGASGGGGGGGSSGGTSGGGSQRPATAGQLSGASSVQFADSSIRPTVLVYDDNQDISAEASSNLTNTSLAAQPLAQSRPELSHLIRPVALVPARRPIVNMLAVRRPPLVRWDKIATVTGKEKEVG